MWPSFSDWAWRILKMRSCLRRPEVPWMSRPRASLPSSAMLCSLSSEIVMRGSWDLNLEGCFADGVVRRGERKQRVRANKSLQEQSGAEGRAAKGVLLDYTM